VGFDGLLGRSDEDEQFASLTGCGLQTDEPPKWNKTLSFPTSK
jgi:hypothetical protein